MTSNQTLNGDDLDQILAENGALGEWEVDADSAAGAVERWHFPRFLGAEDIGDMYLSRPGLGNYDTDVETIGAWLGAKRNLIGGIMLLGDPGCGKTALAQAACTHADREYVMLTATPDDTKDSLRIRFVGEGHGENGTPFVLASLARAAQTGLVVIVDEFMLYMDGVKPLFYPLLDGSSVFPEGNVDGTDLKIHPDFRVIVTANPQVRGASLPEPIGSRFASTTVTVETSASLLRDLDIDESVVAAWEALGAAGMWRPQVREMRLADFWLTVDPAQAVSAFLPEHCPESQRVQIRNMVVGFLGGDIREDGRLVVS